jgi:hypothetical protein
MQAEAYPGSTHPRLVIMSTPVKHFHADAAAVAALSTSLSPERLATYLRATQGDMDGALALHVRNAALGSAFFGPLQALEVALRNAMHRELSAAYGTHWWAAPGLVLDWRAGQTLADTQAELTKHRKTGVADVVGALSFGFWVALLTRGGPISRTATRTADYEAALWRPALRKAFPHARLNRKSAHQTLDDLRRLRNRIAHHEPIFQRNLASDWTAIETVLGWICPVTRDWVVHHSRVVALLQHPVNAPIAH